MQTQRITRWQYAHCLVMCAYKGIVDVASAQLRKRSQLRLQQVGVRCTYSRWCDGALSAPAPQVEALTTDALACCCAGPHRGNAPC